MRWLAYAVVAILCLQMLVLWTVTHDDGAFVLERLVRTVNVVISMTVVSAIGVIVLASLDTRHDQEIEVLQRTVRKLEDWAQLVSDDDKPA